MAAKDKEAAEAEGSEGSGSGSRRNALWGRRVAKFLSSCSGSLGSTGMRPCAHLLLGILVTGFMPCLEIRSGSFLRYHVVA